MSDMRFEKVDMQKINAVFFASLVATIVLGVAAILLSGVAMLILPFLVGTLAAFFSLDRTKKHWVSFLISFLLVLFDLIFNSVYSIWCFAAVLLSVIITFWFVRNSGKALFIGASTVLFSFLIFASFYLTAFSIVGFDLQLANEYLGTEVETLREMLGATLNEVIETTLEGGAATTLIDAARIPEIVELYISMLPSFVVIVALSVVALSNVVFLFILGFVSKKVTKGTDIFCTSPAMAVFFVILSVIYMFESDGSVFNISMLNLYNVFLVIYAYVGFRFASYFFAKKINNRALSVIILLVLCVLFSGFSLNLLSVVGVFETFAVSRMFVKDGNNNYKGGNDLE